MKKFILLAYFLVNLCMFYMMYRDKRLAKNHRWRISEKALIMGAIAFGGLGMLVGMKVFHHKTNHTKFKLIAPLTTVIQIGILLYYILF